MAITTSLVYSMRVREWRYCGLLLLCQWLNHRIYVLNTLIMKLNCRDKQHGDLQRQLKELPSVAEIAIASKEGIAYLKVDTMIFNK